MTVPRFVVGSEALAGTRAVLTGPELHHLRVRRLRIGDDLILCDGAGRQRPGSVALLNRERAIIHFTAAAAVESESPLRLTLAHALVKADKIDLITEKSTELGVQELLLVRTERSLGHVSPGKIERWNRIARAATKQCQRSTVPRITGPISFDALLERGEALRLLFWESDRRSTLTVTGQTLVPSILAAVGPEGGFSAAEAAQAAACGFRLVGLGARLLRTETAAIVAATLCQFLWGDLRADPLAR